MDDHKAWLAGVFDRAASTYDRVGDAYHGHFAGRLLDLTAPPRDADLLDIACGRGAVLIAAAARGLGRLTGIDVSSAMIELAGADVRAAGITDVDLRVMDAELLSEAAFTDLQVHEEETEIRFASKQQWWVWHWSFSVRGLLEQLPPDALDANRDGCFREMDALHTDDGYPFRLNALMVTGRS